MHSASRNLNGSTSTNSLKITKTQRNRLISWQSGEEFLYLHSSLATLCKRYTSSLSSLAPVSLTFVLRNQDMWWTRWMNFHPCLRFSACRNLSPSPFPDVLRSKPIRIMLGRLEKKIGDLASPSLNNGSGHDPLNDIAKVRNNFKNPKIIRDCLKEIAFEGRLCCTINL